jgi:hypothetical protein
MPKSFNNIISATLAYPRLPPILAFAFLFLSHKNKKGAREGKEEGRKQLIKYYAG